MGALQVEVKVLKEKPLLFAWENKHNHQVESYLITCQCQNLGLEGAKEDDKKGSNIFQEGDVVWALKLAHALEKSDLVSLASLEPCVTMGYGMEYTRKNGKTNASNNRKRAKQPTKKKAAMQPTKKKRAKQRTKKKTAKLPTKKKRAKQPTEKKGKKLDHWKIGQGKKVVKGRHVDPNEMVEKQTVVTTEAREEQTQSESQKSMQEELPLSAECSEGQIDLEESNRNNENSTVDVTKDCGSNEEVTNSKPVGADVNNASKESLDCTFSDSNYDNEESNVHDVLVHKEDGSTGRNKEHLNDFLYGSQIIPTTLQLCVPDGAATAVTKDQTTITQVTSSSNLASVPVSEEEALINVISSMVDVYPGAVIKVPQTEQDDKQMNQKRDKPDFIRTPTEEERKNMSKFNSDTETITHKKRGKTKLIRTLTEEERKNMFRFRSDIDEENLKKFQEGGNFFLCELCGKVLSLCRQKHHMEIHSGLPRTKDFICDQCGKKYIEKSALYGHIRHSHRSEREQSVKCHYCPKTFKTTHGRVKHERAHFNIYPAVCNRCGHKFVDVPKYKAHIASACTARLNSRYKQQQFKSQFTIHKDDPLTSTCNMCGKILRTGSMKAHLDMHAGKMYTCPVCNKLMKFATRYAHMETHKEERKYVCEVCNKSFKFSGVLKTHMRIHTGEKPLKCSYCKMRFSNLTSQRSHETTHAGERRYSCTICNKTWKHRKAYMQHMKKHHPGAPVNKKRKLIAMKNQQLFLQDQTEKQDNLKPKEPS